MYEAPDDLNSKRCRMQGSVYVLGYALSAYLVLALIVASRLLHIGLRRLRQPRIVSEFIVGLLTGNAGSGSPINADRKSGLGTLAQIIWACYMFVTGLEMNARNIFRRPTRDAAVAFAGTFSSLLLSLSLYRPLLHKELLSNPTLERGVSPLILSLLLSNTSSSVLTRLTTELKIGKSDFGRLTVGAGIHTDMITLLLLCIFSAATQKKSAFLTSHDNPTAAWLLLRLLLSSLQLSIQGYLVFKAAPPLLDWVNQRNPEGKRIKGLDLALALFFIAGLCVVFNRLFFFDVAPTAFLVGLFLPREGRVSAMLIRNFNFYLSAVGFPLYLCSIGLLTDLGVWVGGANGDPSSVIWTSGSFIGMLARLSLVPTAGKVVGTLFAALRYGFCVPEALALGLLLNVKGHLHIFCTVTAREDGLITAPTALVMLLAVMSSIIFIPLVVAAVVWRARRSAKGHLTGLQWHDPAAELRIVVGIHAPQDVPALLNLIEATKGNSTAPIAIYAMDLVELTDRADAALVHGHTGLDAVAIHDDEIRETSAAITQALEAYAEDGGSGGGMVTVKRFLTVSMFTNMHVDICNLAQDTLSTLILVPFHRRQRVDGGMDNGHPGFRQVNEKVMKHAPCTVGILVDRGLGGVAPTPASFAVRQVAVIFIGGKDDREALFYAGRISLHAGVHVTAIRFLHDTFDPSSEDAKELHLDDECFAQFCDRHVAGGGVGYVEKYAANGAETVAALRSLEPLYELFLVGRGGERSRRLTAGMGVWAEFPELGPIGDILASSDLSVSASVLVIQQHSAKGHLFPATIDPDFATF